MKKKVMILSLEKGYSGLEKQVVTLANSLVELYDIYLFFLKDTNNDLNINPKINVIVKNNKLFSSSREYYKNLFKDMDVVISTSVIFNKYIIKYANSKKIYWEHNRLDDTSNLKYIKEFDEIVVPNSESLNYYKNISDNVTLINTAIVLPDEQNILDNNNILFVGKLIKDKKVDDLIKVFSFLLKKTSANLYIVGDGPERKALESLIKSNNIHNIYFEGTRNKEEIESIFKNSSLYVTCSENEYTASSIIEAMSYGIPVVAFDDVKNLSSFILDDINGYLLSERNLESMSDTILELISNREKIKSFGICAREKVIDFDINSVKREWIKII